MPATRRHPHETRYADTANPARPFTRWALDVFAVKGLSLRRMFTTYWVDPERVRRALARYVEMAMRDARASEALLRERCVARLSADTRDLYGHDDLGVHLTRAFLERNVYLLRAIREVKAELRERMRAG